jgi:hypothetical protein
VHDLRREVSSTDGSGILGRHGLSWSVWLFVGAVACRTSDPLGDEWLPALAASERIASELGVTVVLHTETAPLFEQGDDRFLERARSPEEAEAALETLRRELTRYPPAVRQRLLGRVEVGAKVLIDGRPRVGSSTCRGRRIALSHQKTTSRGQQFVAMGAHHELAHLLMCDVDLAARWGVLSSERFDTGRKTMVPTVDPDLLTRGWVTNYGASDPAEDFAEYVSTLLIRPADLAERARAWPRVAEKSAFVIEVYRGLGVDLDLAPFEP